jgi:hypothetical protein
VEQAFRWTKPAASSEIGVGDFEDLAASFVRFLGNVRAEDLVLNRAAQAASFHGW